MTERRMFEDLRSFMDALHEAGELQDVRASVDKDWELGAICRETQDRVGPALVFRNITGHRTPLVTNVLGTVRRYALALDVPSNIRAIQAHWKGALLNPVKPVVVQNAPCKEIKLQEIDLARDPFPVPLWHPLDHRPALGTFHAVITREPGSDWLNVGMYRNLVYGKDVVGCSIQSTRHIARHWRAWKKLGKPMPIAIAVGLDPYLILTGVSSIPAEHSEYEVAGGLKGSPIQLVQAETSDLLVPANAEMILEGEISLDETIPQEGPFGEFAGYQGLEKFNAPLMHVRTVTHRRDPYFQGTLEGRAPNESTIVRGMGRSMIVYDHLRRCGMPGIVDVCVTPGGCAQFHCVVSIEKIYEGQVREIMGLVWGQPDMYVKHVIVVDEDIDPWDPAKVEWAIATRVQASRDVEILRHGSTAKLDPSSVPSRRGITDLMGIDATKPIFEYQQEGREFPPLADPTPEDLERVRQRWAEYGIRG